jgi:tetratricopeptide (TPR) repeat protein
MFSLTRKLSLLPSLPIPAIALLGLCTFLCGCQGQKEAEKATTTQETAESAESAQKAEVEAQQQLEAGNFSGAVPPLRDLARLRPDTPDVLDMLGTCVLRSPNRDKYLEEARKDLQRDPKDVVALTIAANALTGPENEKERIDLFRTLVELRPHDRSLRLILAQELVNAHLYAEARPHLDALLQPHSDSPAPGDAGPAAALPYYLSGKARFYKATNAAGLSAAEADLKEAVQRNSRLGWPYLYLARIELARNQPAAALGLLKEAEQRMPGNPEVLFELTRAYRAQGDKAQAAKAEAAFRDLRALELRCTTLVTRCGAFPNDFDLHLQTATALMQKGDIEQAFVFARRALTLRPDDTRARSLVQKLGDQLRSGALH